MASASIRQGATADGASSPAVFRGGRGRAEFHTGSREPRHHAAVVELTDQAARTGDGTPLLRRETRGVELTDAGKLMFEEARVILRDVERAKTGVARCARGETGQINIGSAGGAYFHPLIPAILREFKEEHPGVVLMPEESNTSLLLARLRAGAIDLAFVRPPFSDADGLTFEPLVKEPILIVLNAEHPLAASKSIPLSALARDPLILFPRAINPSVYDAILAAFVRAGCMPQLGQEAPQVASAIPMVAAGFGVTIIPESMCRLRPDGVMFVPVEGPALPAEICLGYRRTERSAAVKKFVSVARRRAQAQSQSRIDQQL